MTDFPKLIPPWSRVPLVHDDTGLFDAQTQDALDARYAVVDPALEVRRTITLTTSPLDPGLQEVAAVPGTVEVQTCLKVVTTSPARVRLYATQAQATADVSRATGTDPTGDHGCLLELITIAGTLSWTLTPAPTLTSFDTPAKIWSTVSNTDTTQATIIVTFTVKDI